MGAVLSRRRFRRNRSPQTRVGPMILEPVQARQDFWNSEESLHDVPLELESGSQLGVCAVCYETDPDAGFPSRTPTSKCSHPINICMSCLETYVCTRVEDRVLKIICPTTSCRKYLDAGDVQAALVENKLTFDRFCEQKLWATLRTETNFFRCKAPECSSGQIHTGGAECPIVICEACSARGCFIHNAPWHEGKTCAEYTKDLKLSPKRARQVKKSEKWVKSKTKACPGEGCGRPIQKNSGCDHMVCREPGGCGHEFCWLCLAPYGPILDQGNSLHNPDCRYHG